MLMVAILNTTQVSSKYCINSIKNIKLKIWFRQVAAIRLDRTQR